MDQGKFLVSKGRKVSKEGNKVEEGSEGVGVSSLEGEGRVAKAPKQPRKSKRMDARTRAEAHIVVAISCSR